MRRVNRVNRANRANRVNDERGIVLLLTVVSVVVIMAMGALVIDVGAMLQERRELQNGADAAALAVAHSCALGEPTCASPTGAATSYAGSNAGDGTSSVDLASVDLAGHRVTVRTSTRTSAGTHLVPFQFGAFVTGTAGETLHATSVAAWGPPGSLTTIALAMSKCEFDAVAFGAATVVFHTSNGGATGCKDGPAGKDIPGGFGWLDSIAGANCQGNISAGGTVTADTGVSAPKVCDFSTLLGKTVLVPIFDNVTPSGTKATYHIAGFGAFVLTGYRFPSGGSGGSPIPCKSPSTCIGGTFTQFVTDAGTIGGGDFGVSVIKLVR